MDTTNLALMEREPVPKAILTLSIPTLLSTIVSLLYNLTDTYFIGLLDDPIQLGAISLAFPVFMVIQAIGNVFGNGAPSYVSRCLGAGNRTEARRTGAVAVYISTAATIIITALCFVFLEPILKVLGTSPDTLGPTRRYVQIVLAFSVFMTLQSVLPALLRSEGKVKEAVIYPRDFQPSRRILSEVLKIGLPSSIAQIIMSFSNIMMNNLASGYGDYVISAYGVAGKLTTMVFMITIGYISGYMPFAGYNYGAGKYRRMLSSMKFSLISGTGLCLVLLIPFLWLAPGFLRLFTSDPQIIDVGVRFLRAYAWVVPFMAVQMTVMCTFQAVGDGVRSMLINLGRQLLFYIPFLYLFNHLWGLTGLLYAQTGADICVTILAVLTGLPLLHKLSKTPEKDEPLERSPAGQIPINHAER